MIQLEQRVLNNNRVIASWDETEGEMITRYGKQVRPLGKLWNEEHGTASSLSNSTTSREQTTRILVATVLRQETWVPAEKDHGTTCFTTPPHSVSSLVVVTLARLKRHFRGG